MDDNQQQPFTTTVVHDVVSHVVDNVEPNTNVNHHHNNDDDENSTTTTNFVSTGTTLSDNDHNNNNDNIDNDDDCKESSPLITKEDSTDVLSNSDNITPVDDHHNDDTTTTTTSTVNNNQNNNQNNNNNSTTVDTVVVNNETNDNADQSTENDEDCESLVTVPLLSQQQQQPSDSTSTCSSSPIPPLQLSQLNSNTNEEEEEEEQPTITTTTTTANVTTPTTTTTPPAPTTPPTTTTNTNTPITPKLSPSVISSDLLMTPRSSSARALSLNLTSSSTTTTTTNSDAVLPLTNNNTTTTLTTDSSSKLLLPSSAPSPRTRHSIAVTTPNATLNNNSNNNNNIGGGGVNVQSPSPRSSGGQFNFHNRNANMIQSSYDTLTDSELDSLFDRLLQSRGVSQNNVSLELAKYSRKQKILLLQMRTSQVHGVLPDNNNNIVTTTTANTNTNNSSNSNNNNSTMSASMLVVSMSNTMNNNNNNNNNNSTNKSPTTTAIVNNNASSSSSSLLTPPISPKLRDQQPSSLPLPSSSSSTTTTTIVESCETSESSTSAVPVTCTTTSAMNESIDEHHQSQDDESSTSTMLVESNNSNNNNVDAQDILFTPAVLTTPGKTRKSKKSRHQLNSVPYFIDVLNIVLHHYQTSNSEDDNRRKKKYLDRLRSLTDCLRTCDVFYVLSFIQIGGIGLLSSLLIHVIRFVHSKNQSVQMTALMMDVDIQQQVVLCISSLLDTGEGLEAVIHNPEVINTLCISLDFDELIQCTNHYETMKRNESLKHSQKLSKRRNHHHNKKNIVSSIFSGGGGSSNNENSSSTSSTNSMDHHPDENTSMGGGGSRVIVGNTMLGGNNLNFKMSSALKATCLYWKKQIGIRIHLLYLLSVLCYASEEIYCVVLEAMNHYKLMKREVSRFSSLVKSFLRADVTEPLGLEYVTHALMFMNALYYAPNDATQRNHLYKEFGMMGVTQHLNAILLSSPYPKLQRQVQMYLDFEREELDLFKLIVQGVNTASESKSAGRDLFSESSLGSSSITSPFSTDSVTSPNNAVVPSDNMDQQQQTAPTHHRDSNYDEEYQMFSMLEDPLEMTNFIRNRVSGLPTANSSFTNTIRYMMLVSMKHSDSTLTQDWTAMEDMIFQAISLNSNTQTLDVNHASPTELKLQNTVEIQYKKIKELERERNKAIALLQEKIERKPSTETIDDDLKQKDLIRTLLEYFNGAGGIGVGLPDVGAGVAAPPPPPPLMMGGPPPPPPPLPPMIGGGPPPPPPPPMIGGGPPPPPMMGGGPGGPPPPPMMGMGPQLPKLPTVRPKGLTKKVFVNDFKINNPKISKTLWFDIVKKYVLDVAKDINWDEIERQYTKAEKKKKAEPEKVVEQKVSFLDANQNRQISLLRGYMKIDPPTFRKAIIDMNYNVVAKQIIHTMKNLCPTDDKMTEMMEYSKANGTSLLDPGDHMFHVLGDIPRLKQKFACWSFMLDYEELIAPMRVNVECLWTAAEQMMESKTFHKLLAIILDVINFLNPKASQVYGFKLLFLTKLEDVRTEGEDQPPGNLLKTITSFCCDHAKYATMLTDTHAELNSLKNASIIEISELKNDLSKLTEGMSVITSELNEIKKAKSHSDPFSEKFLKMLTKFQSEAKDDLSDVNEALKHFEEAMKKASAAFEEKESDMLTKPHEFFKVVKQVLDRMNQYAKEIAEAKEAAEKDKIKQELRKQKELEKMAQQKQKLQREMDIALKIEEEASQIMQGLPSPDRPSSPTAAPSSLLSSSLTNSSSVTSPNGMDSPTRRNSSLLTNVGRDMTEGTIGHQLMRARQRHMRINASLGAGISRLLDVDEEEGNAASLLRNSKNYEHQMEDMMTHCSTIDTNMSSSPKPMSLVHLIHLSKHRRDSEENIDNTLPQKQHVTLSGLSTTSSDDEDGSTTATESDDSQKDTTKKRSNTISIATSLRKPFRSLFGRTKPK